MTRVRIYVGANSHPAITQRVATQSDTFCFYICYSLYVFYQHAKETPSGSGSRRTEVELTSSFTKAQLEDQSIAQTILLPRISDNVELTPSHGIHALIEGRRI